MYDVSNENLWKSDINDEIVWKSDEDWPSYEGIASKIFSMLVLFWISVHRSANSFDIPVYQIWGVKIKSTC